MLGANLDRYSNGLEIGRALERERGRSAERVGQDHVMSFMQYGGSGGADGLGVSGRGEERVPGIETTLDIAEDVPPAYEANEGVQEQPEIKSPSGRMGMSLRA